MMPKYKINIKCFNTDLRITLNKTDDYSQIVNMINTSAKTLHNSFNIYDKNSEVSKLNYNKQITPSEHLINIIQIANKYEQITNYHFNTNKAFTEEKNIFFSKNIIKINSQIDLGGIAKGYFMSLIKEYLKDKKTNYEIDFGGALLFEQKTIVNLRHIHNHQECTLTITLNPKESIHTSSFYWQDNNLTSHIFQKQIGYLKIKKSISVIDQNPILSDALSTALYSMNLKEALYYIKKLKLKVIYVLNNDIYISHNITNYKLLKNNLKINIIKF